MKANLIILFVVLLLISGCSFMKPKEPIIMEVMSPYCQAISTVPYTPEHHSIDIRTLDIDSVEVSSRRVNGVVVFEMSFDSYENIINILVQTENFIRKQSKELDNMVEYYDP